MCLNQRFFGPLLAGLKAARSLLEPMLKDSTDFVRQGAAIATALVLLQQPEADGVSDFRKHLESTIGDKHEDNVCKMGAIMASGILDAGACADHALQQRFVAALVNVCACIASAAELQGHRRCLVGSRTQRRSDTFMACF